MNKVHRQIIDYIRKESEKSELELATKLKSMLDDEQIVRMMFISYRGSDKDSRGMRLTNFGLQLMMTFFQSFEITLTKTRINASELLYLDNHATLPYFLEADKLVVFETDLGMKIKLAGNDLTILMGIDGPIYRKKP